MKRHRCLVCQDCKEAAHRELFGKSETSQGRFKGIVVAVVLGSIIAASGLSPLIELVPSERIVLGLVVTLVAWLFEFGPDGQGAGGSPNV